MQLDGGIDGDVQGRDMGGEEILTATSTDPTEAGANLAHQSPST